MGPTVDDATALRVKKVELSLHAAEKSAELQAHRCIAVLAVGLTVGASAAVAGLAGQLVPLAAAVGTAAGAWMVLSQLRALRVLASDLDEAMTRAMTAIDSLMGKDGETGLDAQADGQGA